MNENSLYTAFQVTLTMMIQSKKKAYQDFVPTEAVALASDYLAQTKEGQKHLSRFKSSIMRPHENRLLIMMPS